MRRPGYIYFFPTTIITPAATIAAPKAAIQKQGGRHMISSISPTPASVAASHTGAPGLPPPWLWGGHGDGGGHRPGLRGGRQCAGFGRQVWPNCGGHCERQYVLRGYCGMMLTLLALWSSADYASDLECVSSGTIRKFEWIFRPFKETPRRLSSAKSREVTQRRRSRRNCGLGDF